MAGTGRAYYKMTRDIPEKNWLEVNDKVSVYDPHCYEILQTSTGTFESQKRSLLPNMVSAWLRDSKERALTARASLRILLGQCTQANYEGIFNKRISSLQEPLNSDEFKNVLEAFCVPPQFMWALQSTPIQASRFCGLTSADWAYVFTIGASKKALCTVSVSYNSASSSTSVLLLIHSHYSNVIENLAILQRKEYQVYISQPMLVPFVVCNVASMVYADKLRAAAITFKTLEEALGQHPSHNRPKGDPNEVDFLAATAALNSNITRLTFNETRLRSLLSMLARIYEYSLDIDPDNSINTVKRNGFLDHISHLKSCCEDMLLHNKAYQQCAATHIAVVYNFMAQKNTMLNIALAQDSKAIAAASREDSRAMKTIAVVTLVFLPPTYIAAFFAMPLFQWDAPAGASVLNDRFWYYWAITIPLTILILLVWFMFERLRYLYCRIIEAITTSR